MRTDRRRIIQFILFLFVAINVDSAEKGPVYPGAVIEQKEWKVGISIFRSEKNDPALASAASLIPRLLQDEISGIGFHLLTDDEKDLLVRNSIEKKELESLFQLSSRFSSRDEYFFNLNADPSNLKKMDDQISDAYSALRYWQDSPLPPEVIPDKLPVIFPDPPEGGDLWNIESYSPDAFRKNAGLDILIIGSVVKVGDYFGLRISALGSSGEEVLWEGAGGEDELEDISLEAGASARNLVLGRSWSSITVQTEPPSAVITSSGKNVGVGLWADSTLKPGTYIIVITASGYKPKIENITLTPNELRFINVSLEKVDQPQILIRSEPAGASVRLGSIWLGRAPLSVDQPDRVMSVTLEKEGFRTRTVPLYPDVERLTVPLDYVLVDPVDELAAGRKKLYSSIAWFSFSLAPTVILLGVSQNYANMNFASSSPEDYNSSYKAYQISYGLMWGSIAVNIGLLTNVIFKLSRYLKAAEGLSD